MFLDAVRYSTELMQAFMASEEMDNAARYLQAGRRYAHLSDADLERIWADAWRYYYDRNWSGQLIHCIDAAGELTLRHRPLPEHLISHEQRRRIAAHISHETRRHGASEELKRRYDDFVRLSTVWRN